MGIHWSPVDFPHKGLEMQNLDVLLAVTLTKLFNKLSSFQKNKLQNFVYGKGEYRSTWQK